MGSIFTFTNVTTRQIDELQSQQLCALIRLYQHFVIQHHGPDICDDLSSNFVDRRSHSVHLDSLSYGRKPLEIPETSKQKKSPESDFKNL